MLRKWCDKLGDVGSVIRADLEVEWSELCLWSSLWTIIHGFPAITFDGAPKDEVSGPAAPLQRLHPDPVLRKWWDRLGDMELELGMVMVVRCKIY